MNARAFPVLVSIDASVTGGNVVKTLVGAKRKAIAANAPLVVAICIVPVSGGWSCGKNWLTKAALWFPAPNDGMVVVMTGAAVVFKSDRVTPDAAVAPTFE